LIALGVAGIGPFNFSITINGARAEVGEQVQVALLRAQNQLQTIIKDLLRLRQCPEKTIEHAPAAIMTSGQVIMAEPESACPGGDPQAFHDC
jgi:hypothetical protein